MMTPVPPMPGPGFKDIQVLLASNSPRRRELLGMIVPEFTIAPPREVREVYPQDLPAEQVPAYLSRLKAAAYADDLEAGQLLITADTVVILDGEILGKPRDEDDARRMLAALSDNTHVVVTGVTISRAGHDPVTFSDATRVTFGPLSPEQIDYYVTHYRPLDKAGAYGIQEYIGAAGISSIRGCYYNVMGLPLHALARHLSAI